MTQPLSAEQLERMDAYWRAANYLAVGQIYPKDNPLLHEPLSLEHIKPSLLGHWGTTPGQNFIYVHLNRIIQQCDLDVIYISGPGPELEDYLRGCEPLIVAGHDLREMHQLMAATLDRALTEISLER